MRFNDALAWGVGEPTCVSCHPFNTGSDMSYNRCVPIVVMSVLLRGVLGCFVLKWHIPVFNDARILRLKKREGNPNISI